MLIVGTIHGSLNLYDLKDFEFNSSHFDDLDYPALLNALYPGSASDMDEANV